MRRTSISLLGGIPARDDLPPDDLGLESVAEVVAVGDSSSYGYKQGDAVAIFKNGTFSENVTGRGSRDTDT